MTSILTHARSLLAKGQPAAVVRVGMTAGSVPREEGAMMLVTETGIVGSIGGGTLEWKAMAEAQRLLRTGGKRSAMQYVLGPDLGQCCGGRVEIVTERLDGACLEKLSTSDVGTSRKVFVFGAGHVGRSLIFSLAQMPLSVIWCDPRPGAFPAAVPGNVTLRTDDDLPSVLAGAAVGSMAFVLTHSHALDFAIVDASLRNPAIAVTGLIGSATKRARFERRLADAGVDKERITSLVCPIGIGAIRSKRPEAIGLSTAAQIVALDESLKLGEACPAMDPQTGSFAS